MKNTLRIALAALVASFATAAHAQLQTTTVAPASQNYLQFRAGIYSPQSSDMDGMGSGFSGDVVYGRVMSPNIAIEGNLGYFSTSESQNGLKVTVSGMPILASGRLFMRVNNLEPYALAGLGMVRSTFSAEMSGYGSADMTATAFAFQLGAGVRVDLTPKAYLGLDLRYLMAEPKFEENGQSAKVDISGTLVSAAIGMTF